MSWLRLDDDFGVNAKVLALTDREFRRWISLLLWCAKSRTPDVPNYALKGLGISKRTSALFVELGLLDEGPETLMVHDWEQYNPPSGAERQKRYRNRNRNVTRNVTVDVTSDTSLARARVPVPQVPTEPKGSSGTRKREKDELWDALTEELGEVATSSERGRRNHALKELREIGATPADVHSHCTAYRRLWPGVSLTATALAANWSLCNGASGELSPEEKRARRMEQVNRSMAERGLQ